MAHRRVIVLACIVLAGCNLLSGAADLTTTDDVTPDPGDGAAADAASKLPFDGGPGPGLDATKADASSDAFVEAALEGGFLRPDGGRFVFASSTLSTGDLDGTVKADERCTALAASAGLGGTWIAWLSTEGNNTSPASRLPIGTTWYLVTGERVGSRSALTGSSAQLDHSIDRTELGVAVVNGRAWTGGIILFNKNDCEGWTASGAGPTGGVGSTSATDIQWMFSGNAVSCSSMQRLYCFEL